MNEVYFIQRNENGPFKLVQVLPDPLHAVGFKENGEIGVIDVTGSPGGGGDALKGLPLSQFAATTSAQLAGIISNETGTNSLVFSDSPTLNSANLVTPALGAATATSINKVSLTQPATSATLTILNGKSFLVDKSLELDGTDGTKFTFPGSSGNVLTDGSTSTLTGKSISGATNTITALPTTALANSSVTYAKIQNVSANSKILGSGATGAGAAPVELTLGANLSISGTTLNAISGITSVTSDPAWAAKGDLIVATGNDTAVVLPVGVNGKFLVADSTKTQGLAYATPSINSIVDATDATKKAQFDVSPIPTATTVTVAPAPSGNSVTVIPQTGTPLQAVTGIGGDGIMAFARFSKRVNSVSLSALTTSIAITTLGVDLAVAPAGLYRVVYYLVATAAGTSGTLDMKISWNDGTAVRNNNLVPALTFGTTDTISRTVILKTDGVTNITYSSTLNSPVGSPAYSLDLNLERLQ